MENLILMLEMLKSGTRGVRRKAIDKALELAHDSMEDLAYFKCHNKDTYDRLEELAREKREEWERAERAEKKVNELQDSVKYKYAEGIGGKWRVVINRRLFATHKIETIIALRTTRDLGLKEAKELAEAEAEVVGSGWFVLSENVNASQLGQVLGIFLKYVCQGDVSGNPPRVPDDIQFARIGWGINGKDEQK